jgi:integrase/recombinase XerC/integrase/recombinase XerD
LVRLERREHTLTLASAIAAFLSQHDLSPSSQRVYASALRDLKDGLGADILLAKLDEPQIAERLGAWFNKRYDHTAPATRVRQLAILCSACGFWRQHA